MARKARAEVEGGLYHVITRGNNRQQIFNVPTDCEKFLSLLAIQKTKLPFFLYAYCLMPNHVHLLIEREADAVGRIMHRVLTGYSQYYNRGYSRVGHLLQGRYKAILCQSDEYLTELVRYIHLNPVRANMVSRPEQYRYSGHRAYLGLDAAGLVDADPVLRHFGAKKNLAREAYSQFVSAGMRLGHRDELYTVGDGRILGNEEFVDATIHRIGEASRRNRELPPEMWEFDVNALANSVEKTCRISRAEFFGSCKRAPAVAAKELFLLIGSYAGASPKLLSEVTGMSRSAVSRRLDAARLKVREKQEMTKLAGKIKKAYERRRRESHKSQA